MAEQEPRSQSQPESQPAAGPGGVEHWGTRVGVILAVTGSAVGLGNFLRFPGVAAEQGGGVFMIPYIIAFLLLGLPIAWVEWSMGRYGGRQGYNSLAGIFFSISRLRGVPYLGVFGLLLPVMVYSYYIYVVGWCLAYAWYYLSGRMTALAELNAGGTAAAGEGASEAESGELMSAVEEAVADGGNAFGAFFERFVGAAESGWAYANPLESPLIFVLIAFILNFFLIYRGITKGIEWFCRLALPTLVVIALIILVRVLTLGTPDPEAPHQNVMNGLGYMWNPAQQVDLMAPGDDTLAAALEPGVAEPVETEAAGFDRVAIADLDAFLVALREAGWRPAPIEDDAASAERVRDWLEPADAEGGEAADQAEAEAVEPLPSELREALQTRWTHEDSRLRMDVAMETAQLSVPGFVESLLRPGIWLAAAGQIFFSLSVGFGVIVTYASYMRRDDDVALSSVTAASGNGFCEIVLAGLTIIPAGFIFLGAGFVASPPGTFGMGFVSLPNVFAEMAGGRVFGFLFFLLLFLAALTSTISLLQPAVAFFEEGLNMSRRASVALLGLITAFGAGFVVYFSQGFIALDTIDFWTANVGIVALATIAVIMYGWVLGIDKGMDELRHGAEIPVPAFVRYVIKYVSPVFLIAIFVASFYDDLGERLYAALEDAPVAMSLGLIVLVGLFFLLLIGDGVRRWRRRERTLTEVSP